MRRGEDMLMLTRRQFLKAAGGSALALTVFQCFRLSGGSGNNPEITWTGPKVRDGLSYQEDGEYIQAFYKGEPVLITDPSGMELMKMADGSRSLDELMRVDMTGAEKEAIADFFLTLGQSGWLDNRLEVYKYAVEI